MTRLPRTLLADMMRELAERVASGAPGIAGETPCGRCEHAFDEHNGRCRHQDGEDQRPVDCGCPGFRA